MDKVRPKLKYRNDSKTKFLAMSKRDNLVQFKEVISVARKAIR